MNDADRRKRPAETDLEWRLRIAKHELSRLAAAGPLLTPEAERKGNFSAEFVMHLETQTLAWTKRNRNDSPLFELLARGSISQEQYSAGVEIAEVIETITRPVSLRCASLEARVDNGAGGKDELVERLRQVRLEMTYSRWRCRLPHPKRLVIDMLTRRGSLARRARRHGMDWPRAKRMLIRALDRWLDLRSKVAELVDETDIENAQRRILRKAA